VVVEAEEAAVPDGGDVVGHVAMHQTLVYEGDAGGVEGDG